MLSPDVPEFIPRGYQTPESTNIVSFMSKESTSHPQQTKPQSSTHKSTLNAKSSPFVPKSSPWQGERGRADGLQKQNNTWRQPREEVGNQRDDLRHEINTQNQNNTWRQPRVEVGNQRESQKHELNRHENDTETLPRNNSYMPKKKLPEKQFSQKSKGGTKTFSENLELQIKNKFIPAPNPSHSYTKILKSKQPTNSTPEGKPSKQEFSFSTDDQWPTLGQSLPLHKMPERGSEPPGEEKGSTNPWLRRSNEGSPVKSPMKNLKERGTTEQDGDASIRPKTREISSPTKHPLKSPANPWQDSGAAEKDGDASVRPKTTERNSPTKHIKNSTNAWQERGTVERNGDASVRPRNTEIKSPNKKPIKIPPNAWQERSTTAEQSAKAGAQPRITEGNHKASRDNVKSELDSLTTPRKTEDSHSDNNRLESKATNLPKDQSDTPDNEAGVQNSNVKNTMNTEAKNNVGMQRQVEAAKVTSNTTTQEGMDLFQWKVMGEKKKKVKLKKTQGELQGSSELQTLLKGDNKHDRVLPDKPSPNESRKENQEYASKIMKNHALDLSKTKSVYSSPAQETQSPIKKEAMESRTDQRERKKLRPTKVMSLANCSNDKKEIRPNPKIGTTTAATKPVDEETLQRRLAAKLKKKEEKKKFKEMKAREAKALMRPTDTKVSVIPTNFLEKAKMPNKESLQPSSQATTSTERVVFTIEEYPSLQMQRTSKTSLPSNREAQQSSAPSLPSHRETHQTSTSSLPSNRDTPQSSAPSLPSDKDAPQTSSPSLPSNTNILQNPKLKPTLKVTKKPPSAKGKLQASDLLSGLLPPDANASDYDSDASEECAFSYRTALLTAREKKTRPDHRRTKLAADAPSPISATPQKKKVRTKDPIELDLFALAARSGKNKKKEAVEKLSPTKKRSVEAERVEEIHPRKTVFAANPKAAVVLAKRGKINAKKPKKKKISRVQKCKIEKHQREVLALQFLLEQAKLRQQQQGFSEASSATNNEPEMYVKDEESVQSSENTNQPLNTATKTKADKAEGESRLGEDEDKEKQETSIAKSEWKTEDCDGNKENEKSSIAPHSLPNTNSQKIKTAAEGDAKPKLIWKIKGIQCDDETLATEQNSNLGMKRENTDKGTTSSQQPTEEEPKSSNSPTHQKLLTDDPLVAEKASELIERIKSQTLKRSGPREYCHQVVTPEVNSVAKQLITSLITFQNRHYQRDPTKARIRKRYVCGLKETTKLMGKMSCVIMAPNIQQCEGPGSLDDAVEKLLNQAEKLKVPVVFALSTKGIKSLCRKSSRKVSCFGIISYQGAQDLFQQLMQLLPDAQKQYQQLVASGQCTLPKEGEEEEEKEEVESEKKDVNQEVLARTSALLMVP